MTSHVFTEDQNTMEWYIDGIPVAELKRRYEAHDALVEKLMTMRPPVCPLSDDFQKEKRWQQGYDQASSDIHEFLKSLMEVRNG